MHQTQTKLKLSGDIGADHDLNSQTGDNVDGDDDVLNSKDKQSEINRAVDKRCRSGVGGHELHYVTTVDKFIKLFKIFSLGCDQKVPFFTR